MQRIESLRLFTSSVDVSTACTTHNPDMIQISTKQALLIAAAAVVAHPFLTKVVNDWGKYRSEADAWEACAAYASARSEGVKITTTSASKYIWPRTKTEQTVVCREVYGSNLYRVFRNDYTVTKGTSSEIRKGTKSKALKSFYF